MLGQRLNIFARIGDRAMLQHPHCVTEFTRIGRIIRGELLRIHCFKRMAMLGANIKPHLVAVKTGL